MKKNLILYTLLIIYLVVNIFWLSAANVPFYNELINPFLWIVICVVAFLLSKGDVLRVKDEWNKTQSLIIVLIIYSIFYFLLGLVFGYQKTPYSKEILIVLRNLWSFTSIIFFQEYIRNAMVRIEKKKALNFVIITILFTCMNITFSNLNVYFLNIKEAFIYTTSTLIPLIVANGVLTYLSYVGGARLPIIFRFSYTFSRICLFELCSCK